MKLGWISPLNIIGGYKYIKSFELFYDNHHKSSSLEHNFGSISKAYLNLLSLGYDLSHLNHFLISFLIQYLPEYTAYLLVFSW